MLESDWKPCWAPGFWTVLPITGRGLPIPPMEGNLLCQELCGPSEDSQLAVETGRNEMLPPST